MTFDLKNSQIYEVTDKPRIGLRWIVVLILFVTYIVIFYTMNSFAVLIVAMVNVSSTSNTSDTRYTGACVSSEVGNDALNDGNISSVPDKKPIKEGEYLWTNLQQGLILGSYFWGFVISKLLLSRIWERFGQRASISLGITIMGILAISSPLCASISPYALACNRILTGVCTGPITANTQSLLSAWAPRSELSIMASTIQTGAGVGSLLGFFSSGWISEQFGWRFVFYFEGVLSLCVLPLWYFVMRNSPFDHPWLSNYEENILIENKIIKTMKKVPFDKIFTSPYVYMVVFCQFCQMWTEAILIAQGPSFFKYKLGFNLKNASYIIGITNSLSLVCIMCCGRISDLLINKKILSKINSRRMFHMIGSGGHTILFIGISLAGCRFNVVVVLWILVYVIGSSTSASYRLSLIDIAPNFAVIVGSFMAVGNLGNALVPTVVSLFLEKGLGWNYVFYLTAVIDAISFILYTTFMTAEAQPWNFIEEESEDKEKNQCEMK